MSFVRQSTNRPDSGDSVMRLATAIVVFVGIAGSVTSAEPSQPAYFEQDVAASNALRIQQAGEYDVYIRHLQGDRQQLAAVLHPDYGSPEAFVRSTENYRKAFCQSIGYPAPGDRPDDSTRIEKMGEDGLGTYYRVYIQVLPGIRSEGIYIVPKGYEGRRVPLVIAQHGGAGSPEKALFNGGENYHDMVRGAVKRGYAVFAPQLLFSSPGLDKETRKKTDQRLRLVGTSISAVEATKIIRSIDVLVRRPEIDPSRIAMVGLSYGGYFSLVVSAIDPRIKVTVSSGYFGVQEGRYARDELSIPSDLAFPGRFTLFRDPELVALICPRPLQIQAGSRDDEDHREPGVAMAPTASDFYRRLGMDGRFEHKVFDGGHEFNDELAWGFVAKHL
jgi:dienelactone hydrolase